MTLDSDAIGWKAHEALERGVNPSLLDGEPKAVALVAEFLGEHALYLSPGACMALASKIVTNRAVFAAWFRDIESDRGRTVLRQQPRHEVGDIEALEEAIHHDERELDAKRRMLADAKAGHRDNYSPDERGADADDRRLSEERAAERAVEQAPRVRAS